MSVPLASRAERSSSVGEQGENAMITDRDFDLPREAVSELARLRGAVGGPTRFLARLYASALEEWAGRLGIDRHRLDRLVLMGEAVPDLHPG